MLHPFIRPRWTDLFRRRVRDSDPIARVAAQNIHNTTPPEPSLLGPEVLVVVLGLLALSWSLGGC